MDDRTTKRSRRGPDVVDTWRELLLNRVLSVVLAVVGLAGIFTGIRFGVVEGRWAVVSWIASGWGILAVIKLARSLDSRIKALFFVIGICIASIGSISEIVFVPNPYVMITASIILLAMFAGARTAWWVLGGTVLVIAAIAWLFVQGIIRFDKADIADPTGIWNWTRVILIFATISAGMLAIVSYFISRLESALRESQTLLDALSRESEQRIAALEHQSKLETQLRQTQKLEAVGTLSGGIAHDFNNILTVIVNYAQLIQHRGQFDDRARDSLKMIHQATQRGGDLTRRLLAFCQYRVAERDALELNEALNNSISMIKRLFPENVDLRLDVCETDLHIWGAQVDVDQVVMNLCVNARDAMPNGGTLHIASRIMSHRRPDDVDSRPYVCLSVKDTGIGMSEEQQQRMFDPFFTTKPMGSGTGLGLSIVRGIVTQVKGFIEVDSNEGIGTEIRVFFPTCELPRRGRVEPTPYSDHLRGNELILLVDDDSAVRFVMSEILRDAGYRVLACRDGLEAVEQYDKHEREIAMVVTDTVMPNLGGRGLYDALINRRSDLPFLFCSGYSDTLSEDFLNHPKRDFIEKPFSRDDVLLKISRLLEERRRKGLFKVDSDVSLSRY